MATNEHDSETTPADEDTQPAELNEAATPPAVKPRGHRHAPVNRAIVAAVLLGGLVGWVGGAGFGTAAATHASAHTQVTVVTPRSDARTPVQRAQQATVTIAATPATGEAMLGSGVVLSSDGYIATTAHLVASATTDVVVTTSDGVILPATFIGTDSTSGITVLKVTGATLHPALAATRPVTSGDDVITVGADNVIARGNVAVPHEGIRTDTASDPVAGPVWTTAVRVTVPAALSNDGGPVVNTRGELLGVTAATGYTGTATDNIGSFAVTTDVVSRVASDLIRDGKAHHSLLGVTITDSTTGHTGAVIGDVTTDGPADHAGIRSGDTIIGFDGQTITNSGDLSAQVAADRPGQKVNVNILRDGREHTVTVTLTSR